MYVGMQVGQVVNDKASMCNNPHNSERLHAYQHVYLDHFMTLDSVCVCVCVCMCVRLGDCGCNISNSNVLKHRYSLVIKSRWKLKVMINTKLGN